MTIHTINTPERDTASDHKYDSLFIIIPESEAAAEKPKKSMPEKPLDKSRAESLWYRNHFWPF